MRLKYITLGIIILLCARSAHASQTIDKRQYADWNSYPYNQIVAFSHLRPDEFSIAEQKCTAQYVAPDIILTARHCITKTNSHDKWAEKGKKEYIITLANKKYTQDLILEEYGYDTSNNDWALLRITNPEFYSTQPLSLNTATHTGTVTSAGFGFMRILTDEEIKTIREHMNNNCVNITSEYCSSGCTANCIDSLISLDDTNSEYKVYYNAGSKKYILSINHLKKHSNCQIINTASGTTTHIEGMNSTEPKFDSTCRITQNDSGGLFLDSSNKIQAIISSSVGDILTSDNAYHDFPQPIESDLYSAYTKMRNSSSASTSVQTTQPTVTTVSQPENNVTNIVISAITTPTPSSDATKNTTSPVTSPNISSSATSTTPSSPEITELENQITTIDKKITTAASQGNLTDEKTFDILTDVATYQELKKQYEAAKAREQSVPNKLLGGLAMGATGIGGQMLASGLAEQRADEVAERDMRAYLATFRCDYGAGRNIVGGETNIGLPGGNELIQYTTEYKQLATQLKSDKEALGMMPGIESETVFDSADTGLYNNVATGRGPGAFTSLSRALLDKNSDDAVAWKQQKDKTASNIKTGAIVAGVGAIGGAIGNMIINHDKDKNTTNTTPANDTPKPLTSDDTDETLIDTSINPDIDTTDLDNENVLIANLNSSIQNLRQPGSSTQSLPVSFKTEQSDFSKIDDTLFAQAFNKALTTQLRKSGKTLDSSKLKDQGKTFLYHAKQKKLNPFVSSGIAFYESTYGTSPAAKNKNNIAGLMSGGKTVTYPSVPDSIAAQARSLRDFYIDKRGNTEINNMTYDGGTTKWKKDVTSITKLLYKTYNELATGNTVQ